MSPVLTFSGLCFQGFVYETSLYDAVNAKHHSEINNVYRVEEQRGSDDFRPNRSTFGQYSNYIRGIPHNTTDHKQPSDWSKKFEYHRKFVGYYFISCTNCLKLEEFNIC
jgi:hypothetical protein